MTTKTATNLVSHLTLAALLIAVAGCASGNYRKGASTAASLSRSADKITAGKAKIDRTLNTFNYLVDNPHGDLPPRFKAFKAAVRDLQFAAKNVSTSVSYMRNQGNAYFKAWDEQLDRINNVDIKKSSAERKAKLQKQFAEVSNSYTQFETALDSFTSELKDIQAALGTDLTIGGVSAVKNSAQKANEDGKRLETSVDDLARQFRELSAAMATTGPPLEPSTQTSDLGSPYCVVEWLCGPSSRSAS